MAMTIMQQGVVVVVVVVLEQVLRSCCSWLQACA
jgi:hypothetical protein